MNDKKVLIIFILIFAVIIIGGCEPIRNLTRDEYRLVTQVEGPEDSNIDIKPGEIVIAGSNRSPQSSYFKNEVVKLEAVENDTGIFKFDGWELNGNSRGTDILEIPITNDPTLVKAKFVFAEGGPYLVEIVESEKGSVIKEPDKESYINGAPLKLTAKPNNGYKFSHWEVYNEENRYNEFYGENPLPITIVDKVKIDPYFYADTKTTVEFEDSIIEKEVRNKVGRPKGVIFISEVRDVEELILPGKSLMAEFPDLVKFENLKVLDIRTVKKDEIYLDSLKELVYLEELRLTENTIADLSPVSELDNLEILEVNNSGLEDADLEAINTLKYGSLKELYLEKNNINDISSLKEDGFERLEVLDLSKNKIGDITPLKDMSQLTILDLEDNEITDIDKTDIENLDSLEILNLKGNVNLTDITSFSNFMDDNTLKRLNLHGNLITDDGFKAIANISSLEEINLQENDITQIPDLQAIKRMDVLDLEGNNITDISGLSQVEYIRELDLSYNDLASASSGGVLEPIDPENPDNKVDIDKVYLTGNDLSGDAISLDIIDRLRENGTKVIY